MRACAVVGITCVRACVRACVRVQAGGRAGGRAGGNPTWFTMRGTRFQHFDMAASVRASYAEPRLANACSSRAVGGRRSLITPRCAALSLLFPKRRARCACESVANWP